MKKAVIYARYSCSQQTEQSIEGQLRRCYNFADENDILVVNTYIDRAKSARSDNRPAFQKMLRDSAEHEFDLVLVWAIDRFARNNGDYYIDKKKLEVNGVILISATEQLSTNIDGSINYTGTLMEGIYSSLASYYSCELAGKIKRGQAESIAKNNFLGGYVPFGYKVVDKKVLVNEDEKVIVNKIFQMYDEGYSARAIVDYLNSENIRNHDKPFKKTTLYALLRNRKYIGDAHFGNADISSMYQPIVSVALFNRVQEKFASKKHSPSAVNTDYILSGKLFCGYCGSPMYGESGRNRDGVKYTYYKCFAKKTKSKCAKKNVVKKVIEDIVIDATLNHVLTNENIEVITDEVMREQAQHLKTSQTNLLKAQLRDVTSQLNNLVDAISKGIYSSTTRTRLLELENTKADLEQSIATSELHDIRITREDVSTWLHSLKNLNTNQPKARAYLVRYFIQRIDLYDDKIVIFYNQQDGDRKEKSELSAKESSELYKMVVGVGHLPNIIIKHNRLIYVGEI